MWWIAAALAGQIVVDGKVPVAMSVDGEMVAQTYSAAVVRVEVPAGAHKLSLAVNGITKRYDVVVTDDVPVHAMVGRSGISIGQLVEADTSEAEPVATGPVEVGFRVAGSMRLLAQVGRKRVLVSPGDGASLTLEPGEYEMTVRSAEGTAVYARGVLVVSASATDTQLVQLAEGGLPETSGNGVRFLSESR